MAEPGGRQAERTVRLIDFLFARGHAADIVLAVMAIEFVWLTRRGWTTRDAALRLGPGVFMMLALRAALTEAAWPWVAVPLLAAFPIHLADIGCFRRRRG